MATAPSAITDPSGWSAITTHAGASDGFAIEWKAGAGAQLAPRQSVTGFTFDSPFFPRTPVTTIFVYSGAPFPDAGFAFTVSPASAVPEPSALALMVLGAAVIGARARRRRDVQAA